MLRTLTILVATLCGALNLSAQNVGDSAQMVESALGRPQMSRSTSKGDVWVYANGVRITFKNGLVVATEGLEDGVSAAPAASASETMTVVPERPLHEVRSRGSAAGDPGYSADQAEVPELPAWFWLGFGALSIVSAVCNIIILVAAFRTGILWGLGSLLVPFVSFVFVLLHWQDTKKPFLIGVGCAVLSVALIVKAGMSLGFA